MAGISRDKVEKRLVEAEEGFSGKGAEKKPAEKKSKTKRLFQV